MLLRDDQACGIWPSLQTHRVDSTLKRRGNGRFHAVSTRNLCGVLVGLAQFSRSPLPICRHLRALICELTLTTAPARSPTPCLDVPSGIMNA